MCFVWEIIAHSRPKEPFQFISFGGPLYSEKYISHCVSNLHVLFFSILAEIAPDLSVFDKLDEVPSDMPKELFPPTTTPVYTKIEARSPSSCESEYSYSSASPPHSPSVSEAGSNAYSTDEGIVEDISDLEGEFQQILTKYFNISWAKCFLLAIVDVVLNWLLFYI